jgi:hypothetical protein
MDTKIKQPGWLFYSAWIVLSTIAIPLAFSVSFLILKLITNWVGDWIVVGGRRHITEDYLLDFVFFPLIWLFTCGLQYILLRRYLSKTGWWFLLTGAGWLLAAFSLFLINLAFASVFLINSFHGFIFSVVGISIGGFQWLLLRKRLPHAGWWILASVLGWSMIPLMGLPFTNPFVIYAIGFFPGITTALAWWFLFNQQQKQEPGQTVLL